MRHHAEVVERSSLPELAVSTVMDAAELAVAEIRLLKSEATLELTTAVGRVRNVAIFVPVLVLGYVFLMVAAGRALEEWLGPVGAAAAIGVANIIIGMIGVQRALRTTQRQDPQ